jgi:hypothetical protein
MLSQAWDPQPWEQMMYFVWLLMEFFGIAVALLLLLIAAGLGMLELIKDEATSNLNPDQEPLVYVLNSQQRKSADV